MAWYISLIYVARQLIDFRAGMHAGGSAALMQPVVTGLSHEEIVDLATYVASLDP